MSILNINENFDLFFDKKWEIWAQSWGPFGKTVADKLSKQWIEHMMQNGGLWDQMLDQVVAAHWIAYKDIPKWVYGMRDRLNSMIVDMVQRYNPEFRYITIKYDTKLQGGDKIIPSIEVRMDSEWFGYDKNLDDPWHTRHASMCFHITHISTNYRGYQGSRKDPWPTPTKTGIIPQSKYWHHNGDWHCKLRHNEYVVFPDGEEFYRNR